MSAEDRLRRQLHTFCVAFPGVTEEMPFDDRTVVFKVGGKIFCLFDAYEFSGCALKCDPNWIAELRASWEGVTTGPYLHKRHWNYVYPEPFGDVPNSLFWELVTHSHELVKQGLPRKVRDSLISRQS
jgi:predicted DNA-binding protein (MmcQ/YjbR family)